jgi:hypothetical protein
LDTADGFRSPKPTEATLRRLEAATVSDVNLEASPRGLQLQTELRDFMEDAVRPSERLFADEVAGSGDVHHYPDVMTQLKDEAKARGRGTCFFLTQRPIEDG